MLPSLTTTFLTLTLLPSLITAADKTFASFDDYINQLPACARSCLSPLYDPVLKSCGATRASTALKDLKCMCRAAGFSATDQYNRGTNEAKCAVQACNGGFRTEIASLSLEFLQFCVDLVGDQIAANATGTSADILTVTATTSSESTSAFASASASTSASASDGSATTTVSASASDGSATSTVSASSTTPTVSASVSGSGTTSASGAAFTGGAKAWGAPGAFVLMAGGVVSFMMVSL